MNDFKENALIITNDSFKKELLKERKTINNKKIITLKELIDKMYFTYDINAIYYLIEKYNYKYDVAKMYLDNLIYINNKNYKEEKLNTLINIKRELDEQGLLIYDNNFKKLIKDKSIYFYKLNYYKKIEKKIIGTLKKTNEVIVIKKEYSNNNHKVYEAETLEDEIYFVAEKICQLLEKNVPLSKIKLTNIDDDYVNEIRRIFSYYNFTIMKESSLYSSIIGQDFLNNFTWPYNISIIEKKYPADDVNILINIINKYIGKNDKNTIFELIKQDLKNTKIRNDTKNIIEVIDFENEVIKDDEYVFMLNFNLNNIPKMSKDEDYITDNIKANIDIDLTVEKNIMIKESVKNNINNIKNLYITYKKRTPFKTFYPSSLIEDLSLETIKIDKNQTVSYSQEKDEIELVKKLDSLIKYGIVSKDLDNLYNNYKNITYLTYDNKYKKINNSKITNYLNNEITLSYSSISNFYKCAFKYYLSNILKIDIYEENFNTYLGSMFHYCLEKGIDTDIDINNLVDIFVKENKKELTNKEKFFIEKVKESIIFTIKVLKEREQFSKLKNKLLEEKVSIKKEGKINVVFKGFIDKLVYKEEENITVVAIVDYKTGQTPYKLNYAPYGLNLQLPVYLYLAKNIEQLKNVVFAGFYIEEVLNKEVLIDPKKTYEMQKKELLKLHGYSNADENIISKFDLTYKDSEQIKSLKFNNSGFFDSRSLVITNEEINNLIKLVENKINEVVENVEKANFNINPKVTDKENLSCNFCNFKDICFKRREDEKEIKEYKDLSFLGGDYNA